MEDLGWTAPLCIKMSALSQGMHATICPPGADDTDFFTRDFPQRSFKFTLHCPAALLNLEPFEIRPVVLENREQARHSMNQLQNNESTN